MLKLPKGLKKKKKKSKKDQELFTEEELEQYKQKLKQQQQHEGEPSTEITSPEKSYSEVKPTEENLPTAQSVPVPSNTEGAATTTEPNKTSEEDEEWKRFKELTSGIDSVLHKTQDELQRIKESSFYQRVPTAVEKQKLEEEENRRRVEEKKRRAEEEERRRKELEEANRDKLAEAVVELSESEEESEELDDIFNTEYIDAITSGEVQLGIVPDSPETELANEGPDPFDTTYAEKLIKGPDVSKRGKKIVSLGSAVEVLTGRVDSAHAVALSGAKKKPRRGIQNLLFDESIDEDTLHAIESELPVTPEPPRTLFDELEDDILDGPIDLSIPFCIDLLKQQKKEKATEGETDNLENNEEDLFGFDTSILNLAAVKRTEEQNTFLVSDDILSEFDVLNTQEDDEFAELAVESLAKKQDVKVLPKVNQIAVAGIVATVDVKFTVDFELPEKVKPARPPPPVRPEGFVDIDDDDLGADDPFDTAFVEQIVPKNDEEDDFDFDPRAGEEEVEKTVITNLYESTLSGLKVTNKKDLLEGSATDLTKLEDTPIAPTQEKDSELDEEFDPFDTSAVSKIVQPKETELKFIEKELLADSNLNRSLSDPDFDPRAEEPIARTQQIAPPTDFDPARRKSSLSLNLSSKSVGFLVPSNNLIVAEGETGKIQKPLTPYYAKPEAILEKDLEDPFDTSFVPKPIPTEVELKHLEKDLLTSSSLKHSLSDPDFDPRAEENPTAEDLLSAKDHINTKVLTPRHEAIPTADQGEKKDFADPFDTSIASNIKPGATELKLLENELLPSKISEPTTVLDTLTDAQELGLGDKVLTPQISVSLSLDIAEVDPFDTSIAENLAPGKTEIKILESEFVGQ